MSYYGTATLSDCRKKWSIDVQPHIAIKLKRIFPQIPSHEGTPFSLSAIDETCSDLQWFATRYPLEFKPKSVLSLLNNRADRHMKSCRLAERILAGKYKAPDATLAIPARKYQQSAAILALTTGGLLVADELGLGKTVTSFCMLADKRTLPAVVVVQAHLPWQWRDELARFLPNLRVHIAAKTTPAYLWEQKQANLLETWPPDVLILTYSKLSGWADTIIKAKFRSLIFDECQELRRSSSYKYAACTRIARTVDFRMGLSGTPIYNYGGEFFNVIDILRPGALGSRKEFFTEWCYHSGYDDKARVSDPQAFGSALREKALMIRRTRRDVDRELPALTNVVHEFGLDRDALEKGSGRATELARFLLGSDGAGFDKMQAAGELSNQLRMATGLAKAPYVAEFVRMLLEQTDEPVVLYGWHRVVYDLWAEELSYYKPLWFTGKESPKKKHDSKRRFLAGESRLLILSLRSGSGLDGLQRVCHRVVFGELDWSPGVHEQCVGRVHRDGQSEPTLAYYLVADEGSDPTVLDVLSVKRGQIERARDPNSDLVLPKQADPDHVKRLAEDWLRRRQGRGVSK